MSRQTRNTLLLVLAAMVWGTAFAVQSVDSAVGAFTFLAGRSWLAVVFLLLLCAATDAAARRQGEPDGKPRTPQQKQDLLKGGLWCGSALFAYSIIHRVGVVICSSPSKAGFLNALYVVFVPILGLFVGRRAPRRIWLCVALSAGGMYLLSGGTLGGFDRSDLMMIAAGVVFAVQVLTVNRWSPHCSGIQLSLAQFVTMGCWATAGMLLFEQPTLPVVLANLPTLLFCGVISSGVGFTLQIVGQKDLNPALASLAMSLESVFCALFSWLFLQDRLTSGELAGCALMFGAVVLAQLPVEDWLHKAQTK